MWCLQESTPEASAPAPKKGTRQKVFDEETKKKIGEMSKPSDMPSDERKRQYAALRRVIYKEASPALLAKFNLCPDAERLLGSSIKLSMR